MQYKLHTLGNGLRVLMAPMRDSETASIVVMTGTGSRYESKEENGLAHFLEHMFFKGTKKRSNARAISEALDGIGAVYNAYTAKDRTAYWAKAASRYFDVALDVITDIPLNATLPAKEIKKERGAVIQEIDMYEDIPMRTVDDVLESLLWGGEHPLGRTILGPKENVLSFTRRQLERYRQRNYTASNTIVAVAGNYDQKKTLGYLKKAFGTLPAAAAPSYLSFVSQQSAPRVKAKEKKTDQTQLMLGVPAYPYNHPDEYALEALAAILGGGMSSRLFLELREKRGLAYSVDARTDKYPDTGMFVIQAGVEHGKLPLALLTILKELRKMKRTPVPKAELRKAKAHLKGEAALALETSNKRADTMATYMLSIGSVRTLEEIEHGIDVVSAADVARVARDIFKTTRLNAAVIGPHQNSEKLLALLRV